MYAIVDIETTGGYAERHRITEIAIYIHDGTQIVKSFSSLTNPSHYLPGYITGLTGITTAMLEDAPPFKEVAEEVYNLLHENIFIAHNVHFDYSFVRKELEACGYQLNTKKLCTVRLSRKLLPGLRSYSLGNIASYLKVPIHARHRAGGDAKATAIIFDKLLRMDRNGAISELLKKTNKEMRLPSNISSDLFEALPEAPGVYYFLNQFKEVIYVGKAKNIKKRISGHFSGKGGSWSNQNIRNQIHDIQYQLTGNEFVALIHESQEIKRLWPKYNSAQKNERSLWGLFTFEDQKGFKRLAVAKQMPGMAPVKTFKSHSDIWHFLQANVKDYQLCSRLCGLHKVNSQCYDVATGACLGACIGKEEVQTYNQRVDDFLHSIKKEDELGDCALVGRGRKRGERSVVLVENGAYVGYGFVESKTELDNLEIIREYVNTYQETPEIRQYIMTEITTSRETKLITF